jgi:cytosine/adenosine deaminase-related metal-dependent hydrolase
MDEKEIREALEKIIMEMRRSGMTWRAIREDLEEAADDASEKERETK